MKVLGAIDKQGRCKHYHGERDIVAIRFRCCDRYYGCYFCHVEHADHEAQVWEEEQGEAIAILCGSCNSELSIATYLNCESVCSACKAEFNPRCSLHYPYYFASGLVDGSR